MATAVISILKMNAVPWRKASHLHPPMIPHPILPEYIIGMDSMHRLLRSYACVMPDWLTKSFKDPESMRHRLSCHEYCQSTYAQQLRSFENLYLLEFKELSLKRN